MLVKHKGEYVEVRDEDVELFKARYGKKQVEGEDLKEVLADFSRQLTTAISNYKSEQEAQPITRILVKDVRRNSKGLIQGCELEVVR